MCLVGSGYVSGYLFCTYKYMRVEDKHKQKGVACDMGIFVLSAGNYRSEVKAVDNSMRTQRVYLHFHGFSARHDIWLPVDSSRKSPRRSLACALSFELPALCSG